jgi:hypothetical protein
MGVLLPIQPNKAVFVELVLTSKAINGEIILRNRAIHVESVATQQYMLSQ